MLWKSSELNIVPRRTIDGISLSTLDELLKRLFILFARTMLFLIRAARNVFQMLSMQSEFR